MAGIALTKIVVEAGRQVIVQGPPLWFVLLTPIVSILGIGAAYFLGKRQGREQTRYQESAKVITELYRLVIEVSATFPRASKIAPNTDDSSLIGVLSGLKGVRTLELAFHLYKVGGKLREFLIYFQANEPWLDPEARDTITPVIH